MHRFTSIVIGNWRLNAVHIIPDEIRDEDEFDFWMDVGRNVYLLRLIHSEKDTITFCRETKPAYIIVEKRLNNPINKDLSLIAAKLKKIGLSWGKGWQPVYHVDSWED